ncbi:pentapeptide repeat-containing protein [Rothia dentocariosa]|jgi:putative uncharacterized protein (fragment)|uniref:pentapeptide repeat-containing protein n=1 Tax=Rothia dentocariosa TaxID=2047 RepID=UPI0039A2DB5D
MTESPKSSKTPKRNGSWWRKNWFYTVLIAVALLGGLGAFWIPFRLPQPFSKGDSISTLRQSILAATGGVLAILTLGENRRKNIQEKEKNDQDHTRQVHAERRARYAKAIEQLADAKAPIRLGGVYTLVKLVDDWMDDEKTLPNEEERREEGQVIINSLCAYIRSTFDLTSKTEELSQDKTLEDYESGTQQFAKDQARFREEQELRLTILEAIRNRLNNGIIIQKDGTEQLLKGPWSDFNYDFSNACFFYPVDFSNTYFGASSNFAQTAFMSNTDFSNTRFIKEANFFGTTFTMGVKFSKAIFNRKADFSKSTFCEDGNFSKVTFNMYSSFDYANFNMFARFYKAFFTGEVSFIMTNFNLDTYFSGATFTNHTSFFNATFHIQPMFASILYPWEGIYIARFSSKGKHKFNTSSDSPCKIETEEKEYNGVKFMIPKGAELFDPDEPSEQNSDNSS